MRERQTDVDQEEQREKWRETKRRKRKKKKKWKQKENANVLSIPNFFAIGLLSFVSSSSAFLFLKLSATMTMATLFPRASCTSKRNAPVAYLTIKELHGAITLASLMALNKELVHIYVYIHITTFSSLLCFSALTSQHWLCFCIGGPGRRVL